MHTFKTCKSVYYEKYLIFSSHIDFLPRFLVLIYIQNHNSLYLLQILSGSCKAHVNAQKITNKLNLLLKSEWFFHRLLRYKTFAIQAQNKVMNLAAD